TSSPIDSEPKQNRRPKAPAANVCEQRACLRAGVQDRDGTAVLRPARDVVADRDRALLAVGDRPNPRWIDAAGGEEGTNRLGAAWAGRDIVFAGAPPLGMAFHGEGGKP